MSDEQATARLGRAVGKYTLDRVIGSGGMGTVYEASHRNGHRVAVKMLKPALAVGSEVRTRFLREGYAANRVRHPGAVRVLDDDVTEDGLVFLVMELLEGWTLDALAKKHDGKLGLRLVLGVGKQLLEVLGAAHDAGIVHRDIKPENVFLQTTGKLKVLDFGIAQIRGPRDGTTTTTGRMLGTPAFMPPEQAYGRRAEVDARSDLWSVGATLFTVISGRVVHHADTAEETLINAATQPAPPLASVADGIPGCVAAFVDRALRAEKTARWQSASEMREALDDAHREVFGGPAQSVIDVRELGLCGGPSEAAAVPRMKRARTLPTWAAPTFVVAALAMTASAVLGDPGHGTPTPVPVEIHVPVALAPIAPPTPKTEPPPIPVAAAPPSGDEQPATLADTRAVRAPAESAATVRTPSSAATPRANAATAAVAPAVSSVCGFDFDEEGRKWPKRCP